MGGPVACRSCPVVEQDEADPPCGSEDPAGWADLEPPDEEPRGTRSDASWVPEVGFKTPDEAVAACLSLHISTETELKGHKVEVAGVEIFKNDVKVRRRLVKRDWSPEEVRGMVEKGYFHAGSGPLPVRGKRKKAMSRRNEPSSKSLLELFHQLRNTDVEFRSVITLTYGTPFPTDGRICAKHQNAFHTALSREFGDHEYAWTKEWQKRGALHLHYASTVGIEDVRRGWLPDTWTRILGAWSDVKVWRVHAHEDCWQPLFSPDDAISRYFAAYISNDPEKKRQKKVPSGFTNPGRPWGVSSGVKPHAEKFLPCDAFEIARRMGMDGPKYYKQCQDGLYRPRTYGWGQSDKFR